MYIRQAFGRSSDDRVSGVITKAHLAGCFGGLVGGVAVGIWWVGFRWTVLPFALLWGIVGLTLMIRVNGMRISERVWLRVGYMLRRRAGATLVPPSVQPQPSPADLTIVVDGELLVRPYQPDNPLSV